MVSSCLPFPWSCPSLLGYFFPIFPSLWLELCPIQRETLSWGRAGLAAYSRLFSRLYRKQLSRSRFPFLPLVFGTEEIKSKWPRGLFQSKLSMSNHNPRAINRPRHSIYIFTTWDWTLWWKFRKSAPCYRFSNMPGFEQVNSWKLPVFHLRFLYSITGSPNILKMFEAAPFAWTQQKQAEDPSIRNKV